MVVHDYKSTVLQRTILLFVTGSIYTTKGIPLSKFYPFGQQHGDSRVPTNDDGSSPKVEISTSFPYFNQLFHSLYAESFDLIATFHKATNSSDISINEKWTGDRDFSYQSISYPLQTYTPSPFPLNNNRKIVAPYWSDIDTRNGGDVWYYETNDHQLLQNASQDVKEMFPSQIYFEAAWLFVATWDNVAFYGASLIGSMKRNTFQCLLITNGRNSFAIFLYNKIEWTTGTASYGHADTGLGGVPAQVGFDAGDGHNFMAINESRTHRVIDVTGLSNVGIQSVHGKFVFRLDTETLTSGGCKQVTGGTLTIFPRFITMFGGTELSVGGPCFDEGDQINIEFNGVYKSGRRPCKRVSKIIVKCISPSANYTGDVEVNLFIQRSNQNSLLNNRNTTSVSGISTYVNPLHMKKSLLYQLRPDEWATGQNVTIGWNDLPFDNDILQIEQYSLEKEKGKEFIFDRYVGRNISKLNRQHTFSLSTKVQAIIFKIIPELTPDNYIDKFAVLPSEWSNIFIPRPAYSIDDEQRIANFCRKWKSNDLVQPPIDPDSVATCPCNVSQAKMDITRFSADPLCSSSNNASTGNNCMFSPNATHCFRMVFMGKDGNDNQCCYDNSGSLIKTTNNKFGGFAHRYHYKGDANGSIPYLSNLYEDIIPFVYCCQFYRHYSPHQNMLCTDFLNRRPESQCSGYEPPRIASTHGDPHIVTLDGHYYTFNGVGEFILLTHLDRDLNIQARMEQFKDETGTPKPASVVTSLVIQCNSSEVVVEIRLNEIRLVDVLVNGELVDFTFTNSVEKKGTSIVSSRGNNITDSIWTSVTCKSPDIALNVTAVKKLINFNLMIVGDKLRNKIQGLLGNYNGRTDDDLTNRNGDIIPINVTMEYIHHNFALSWMTNVNESLFAYPVGKNHDSFQMRDFEPAFNLTGQCTVNGTDVCGNDPACQFDLCTTNDASVAVITRQASEDINYFTELAIPACGVLPGVLNGNWLYSGHSASLECNNGYSPNGETTVLCRQDGAWESTNTTCGQTEKVQETDAKYAVSRIFLVEIVVPVVLIMIVGTFVLMMIRADKRRKQKKLYLHSSADSEVIKVQFTNTNK